MKSGNKYDIDARIWDLITVYWKSIGAEVKGYRDLDHHFLVLSDTCFLQLRPKRKLLIYLPDDPNEKRTSKVTFHKKRETIPFLKSGLMEFHSLMDHIARLLGYEPNMYIHTYSFPSEVFVKGVRRTAGLLIQDRMATMALRIEQSSDSEVEKVQEIYSIPLITER